MLITFYSQCCIDYKHYFLLFIYFILKNIFVQCSKFKYLIISLHSQREKNFFFLVTTLQTLKTN